jgi:hypothetical protein
VKRWISYPRANLVLERLEYLKGLMAAQEVAGCSIDSFSKASSPVSISLAHAGPERATDYELQRMKTTQTSWRQARADELRVVQDL